MRIGPGSGVSGKDMTVLVEPSLSMALVRGHACVLLGLSVPGLGTGAGNVSRLCAMSPGEGDTSNDNEASGGKWDKFTSDDSEHLGARTCSDWGDMSDPGRVVPAECVVKEPHGTGGVERGDVNGLLALDAPLGKYPSETSGWELAKNIEDGTGAEKIFGCASAVSGSAALNIERGLTAAALATCVTERKLSACEGEKAP